MQLNNTEESVREFAWKVIERAQLNLGTYGFAWLKANRRVDASGKLRRSFYPRVLRKGLKYIINYFSKEFYANYVEDGTRPHPEKHPPKMMVESILEWMRVKPIRLRQRRPNALSRNASVFAPQGMEARRQAAWAIATKRLHNGTKPLPFMSEAAKYAATDQKTIGILERGMAKDIELAIYTAAKRSASGSTINVSIE